MATPTKQADNLDGLAAALRGMSPGDRTKLAKMVAGPAPKSDEELAKEAAAREKVPNDTIVCRVQRTWFRSFEARRYKRGQLVEVPQPGSKAHFAEFRNDELPAYLELLDKDALLVEKARGTQPPRRAKGYVRTNQVPEEVETAKDLMKKQGSVRTMSDRAG